MNEKVIVLEITNRARISGSSSSSL